MGSYVQGEPEVVGTVEQLLIDDAIVEDAWDVRRRICHPLRHPMNPVLSAAQPWEDNIYPWRVLYDEREDIYRMYYQVMNVDAWQYQFLPELRSQWSMQEHGSSYFTCYAHSRDGVSWDKPMLDLIPWRTYEKTNIVATGRTKSQAVDVVLNLDGRDERKRLIMVHRDRETLTSAHCRYFAFSADGIHWEEDEDHPAITGAQDDANVLCWDPASKRWFFYLRPVVLPFDEAAATAKPIGNLKRRMAVSTSPDLRHWTFPRTVIYADELDPNPMCMDQWAVFKYGSHFIALLSVMDVENEKVNSMQIASSRDGVTWHRLPARDVFMEPGPEGSFDCGQTILSGHPVVKGDTWYLYYTGTRHGQERWHNIGAVGIAVLPKGRLVGRFADERDGFLLTRELVIGGRQLRINTECANREPRREQSIKVGIAKRATGSNEHLDAGYYEGFSLTDCDPIRSTSISRLVTWQGKSDLGALVGKPAYLRFFLKNAGVYSFRFDTAEGQYP